MPEHTPSARRRRRGVSFLNPEGLGGRGRTAQTFARAAPPTRAPMPQLGQGAQNFGSLMPGILGPDSGVPNLNLGGPPAPQMGAQGALGAGIPSGLSPSFGGGAMGAAEGGGGGIGTQGTAPPFLQELRRRLGQGFGGL